MPRGGGGRGGRGGRGGFGGGRGGGRSVAQNNVPWTMDQEIVLDGKPSELFPPYNVPTAPSLSKKEEKQVSYFLLFREQCHDGPLYTQARTWTRTSDTNRRTYGQEQINKKYGTTSKATTDPFLSVPTYSQKFQQTERTLPDLASRPFAKEFYPPELHATLDGEDEVGLATKRRKTTTKKTLALSNITSLRTAEELFMPGAQQEPGTEGTGPRFDKVLEVLDKAEKRAEDGEDAGFLSGEDDDDWVKDNEDEDGEGANAEEEDQYDDESGDDYNAEQYFEGGDEDDYDDGGDDGGDYM
ncbi:DNA-directed RNA polymerase III, subunit Rpc31 [Diplogelasinospora grovesii]|uniref:DNA-directed RNA polymerase III subunit n=1 Tax=Diplogelasinospora grovesii TaxID=303347 RepID=A0AAN6NCE9_9PEZI|nr:DNA-directed RNA polymerase III, subunit Rpc31 [Diplogelasinospora grovesii]